MRLLAATALALMLADLAAAAWHPPVPGTVTRPFDLGSDPFEAGRHRGVDLASPAGHDGPGGMRRPGRVRRHGRVERPGGHRAVRTLAGDPHAARLDRGPPASHGPRGSAARHPCRSHEHAGLHLGVRRDGTRFGYADPLRFLAPGRPTAPPLGPAPRPTRPPRPTPPRPPAPRPPAPRRGPGTAPRRRTAPHACPPAPRRRAARRRGFEPRAAVRRSPHGRRGWAWPSCSPAPASACARVRGGLPNRWRRPFDSPRRPGSSRRMASL